MSDGTQAGAALSTKLESETARADAEAPVSATGDGSTWMSTDSPQSVSLLDQLMASSHANDDNGQGDASTGAGSNVVASTNAAVEAANDDGAMDLPGLDISMSMGVSMDSSLSSGLNLPPPFSSAAGPEGTMSMGGASSTTSASYPIELGMGVSMQLPLQLPLAQMPLMPQPFHQAFPSGTFQQAPLAPPAAHPLAIAHLPGVPSQVLPPLMHSHLRVVHRASQLGSLSFEVRQLRAAELDTTSAPPETQGAETRRKTRKAFVYSSGSISAQGLAHGAADEESLGRGRASKRHRSAKTSLDIQTAQSYFPSPGAGYMIISDPSRPTRAQVKMQEAAKMLGLPVVPDPFQIAATTETSAQHWRETLATFASAQNVLMLLQRCNLPPPLGAPSSGDGAGAGERTSAGRGAQSGVGGASSGGNTGAPGAWINRGLMIRAEGTLWTFDAQQQRRFTGSSGDATSHSLEDWIVFTGNWGAGREFSSGFVQVIYVGRAKTPPVDARVVLNSLLPASFIQTTNNLGSTLAVHNQPNLQTQNAGGLIVPVFANLSAEGWAEVRVSDKRSKRKSASVLREETSRARERSNGRAEVGGQDTRPAVDPEKQQHSAAAQSAKRQSRIGDGQKVIGEVQAWAWISLIRQLGLL